MFSSLVRTVDAATEPVTTANVKLYTRVSHDAEDDLIDTWIKAGRILAEDYQKRAYITQTWQLAFDFFPPVPFCIPRAPLISVTSLKYYDTDNSETTYSADNYFVDAESKPGRITLGYGISWPAETLRSINAVKILYTAGYGAADDVPTTVKDAIYLYCAYRYENRTAEDGSAPSQFFDLLKPEKITCV